MGGKIFQTYIGQTTNGRYGSVPYSRGWMPSPKEDFQEKSYASSLTRLTIRII
jgi:hypothetical protein